MTLSYVEMGPKKGEPLLLIHGYTDNSRSWSLLAPYLGNRRMIAVDLRGSGESDAPACCYDVNSLAHDVQEFMKAKGIQQADVVGHSLGSMTAATLAAYYPDRVDKLVLISTSTYLPEDSANWLWDNVAELKFPLDPDSPFMKTWYTNPTPVDQNFIIRERAESATSPRAMWMGVLKALTVTDWTAMAHFIEAPTLILWGDEDGTFGAESQKHIKEVMPDAKYITYPGHGHNMFWEVPDRVGEDIGQFLKH